MICNYKKKNRYPIYYLEVTLPIHPNYLELKSKKKNISL